MGAYLTRQVTAQRLRAPPRTPAVLPRRTAVPLPRPVALYVSPRYYFFFPPPPRLGLQR